jgi:hypothetical protein
MRAGTDEHALRRDFKPLLHQSIRFLEKAFGSITMPLPSTHIFLG